MRRNIPTGITLALVSLTMILTPLGKANSRKPVRIAQHVPLVPLPISYVARALPVPRDHYFAPMFLNDQRTVAGEYFKNGEFAFGTIVLWHRPKPEYVAHRVTIPVGLDAQDRLLLIPWDPSGDPEIWGANHRQRLPLFPTAFNNHSQVVGWTRTFTHADTQVHYKAVLWNQGRLNDISDPVTEIVPVAINDEATILGVDHYDAVGTPSSLGIYLRARQTGWQKVHEIVNQGTQTKIKTDKTLLNAAGDILVSYAVKTPTTFLFRAVLWKNGREYSIGGDLDVRHVAMNNTGTVVGQIWVDSGDIWTPFMYQDGQRHDLNALIRNRARLTLEDPVAINNRGDILGWGRDHGRLIAVMLQSKQNGMLLRR